MEVGELCYERLEHLREMFKERDAATKEREALLEEKQQLDKLRRKLTPEQLTRLRELEVEFRLSKLRPDFFVQTAETYDSWCLDVAKILVFFLYNP